MVAVDRHFHDAHPVGPGHQLAESRRRRYSFVFEPKRSGRLGQIGVLWCPVQPFEINYVTEFADRQQ